MPKEGEGRVRPLLPKNRRSVRKVIILNPDDRVVPFGLRQDRFRETPIHLFVVAPVLFHELNPVHRLVKERPEEAIRETVIIMLDLFIA